MGPWWHRFLPGKHSDGEPRGVGSKCQFGTWPPADSHCKDGSIRHPSFYILWTVTSLVQWATSQASSKGRLLVCSKACSRTLLLILVFLTIDSHLKHAFHCWVTLQVKLTTPKVKPADGCLSHIGQCPIKCPEGAFTFGVSDFSVEYPNTMLVIYDLHLLTTNI